MVEITDSNDATVLRRHLGQIHFRESSVVNIHLDDSQTENENPGDPLTDKTTAESTLLPPTMVPVRQASQVDGELLGGRRDVISLRISRVMQSGTASSWPAKTSRQ